MVTDETVTTKRRSWKAIRKATLLATTVLPAM
jgi:hypothetical protein